MYHFVVCAVFKNEAHILDEWISHYLFHGVDHLFLVNDFSTDEYEPIIQKWGDKVSLFQNDIVSKEVGRQTRLYDKFFRPVLAQTKWMAVLDLDEFLYSPYEMSLPKVLERYAGFSQIMVDWVHFGSNGHIVQPNSVVEGFTKRALYGKKKGYYSYKPIFQTAHLQQFGIHRNMVSGRQIRLENKEGIESPHLLINHYNIQSLEYFMKVKATRGDINNWFDNQGLTRDRSFFDNYDDNDVEDMVLYNQNRDSIKKVKENKM
jgi:glycosyltransferase involved in cell wall biosynthesis